MKRLGEILLDRGAIAIAELHTGLEACHYSGGRLGTQLLKFGFVDEHALLEALSEQLSVPSVSTVILRRAPLELRQLIPFHVSKRIQAMVFERKGGTLNVAMTSPRNPAATEEVVSYVGMDITPHVATESGILSALTQFPEQTGEAPKEQPPQVFDGANEWHQLWAPAALDPAALIRTKQSVPGNGLAMAATFPGLMPVPDGTSVRADGALDEDVFNSFLRGVEHRDEIGDLLVRRAVKLLKRCCVLAVHSGHLVGWLGRGPGVVLDDIQSFSAPTESSAIVSKLEGLDFYCGAVPMGADSSELIRLLGNPQPGEVIIVPVTVKNRRVAYLLGDIPDSRVPKTAQAELREAAQKAGLAFEILIMKRKILA